MRVIHLLNHTRRLNGHVHAAIDLACAQQELGHQVEIASGGGDFDAFLADHSIPTVSIDHERRPVVLARALRDLTRHVRRTRPDIIHAHMMTSALLAWPVCRMAGIPLVTTVHNEFQKSSILMGLGTRVIAVSGAVGRSMASRGISASRIDVVLNGTIGSARFDGRDRTPLDLPSPSIVFVGGLHPRKGIDDLLAAFDIVHRRNRDTRLFIVGDGPHRGNYADRARAMACGEAVSFLGAQDNPYRWMAGGDIFVLPSHADPAPLVLSEAREAGCAIVATNVDGIPELLEGGEAGLLVPPHDPQSLAAAILSLTEDPALLAEWRARSQRNIEQMMIERVARDTIGVYETASDRAKGLSRQPA